LCRSQHLSSLNGYQVIASHFSLGSPDRLLKLCLRPGSLFRVPSSPSLFFQSPSSFCDVGVPPPLSSGTSPDFLCCGVENAAPSAKVQIDYRLRYAHMRRSLQASRGPLRDAQPIVIHSRSINVCAWAYGCIYDRWVYEWTTIGLILSCACPRAPCIGRTDIWIAGGCTEPSMFQCDYLYSASTCIENAAVPLDGGWISYDGTMSARQIQVELTLNL